MADITRFHNALRQIVEVSRSIQAKTTKPNSLLDRPPSSLPLASIDFPPPPDVSQRLRSLGITEQAVQKIVETFNAKCGLLQTVVRDKLREMQSYSPPSLHPLLCSSVQKAYLENVNQMEIEVNRVAVLHQQKVKGDKLKPATKIVFNATFVPFLEKYFEYNAYPSAADRALMARNSMMTSRQIEVWFQNHRNRARKEGKQLPRLHPTDPLPPDLCLTSLEEMSDLTQSESEKSNAGESDQEDADTISQVEGVDLHIPSKQASLHVLEPSSSSYAFPAPYVAPPISFLRATVQECTSTFSGVPLPWPRPQSGPISTPSKNRPLTKSQVDKFSELFARLTVRDGPRKVARRKATPSPFNQRCVSARAAVCATTTVLCRGRHPSYVSTPCPPSSSLFPSFPATERRSSSQPDTTSPSSHSRRHRKSPQLPRRVPGSAPRSHTRVQHIHHPYASPSRESSSSSSCRTPSSSSESLSTPRTPDNLNTSLPFQTSTTKSTSIPSYSPWASYFNLPHFGSPSPNPFQSNPSWFPQDLFLPNPFGVSALC
uniref:HD2 homeodomain mating-type protein n=1 Tax=Pleurotus djamor TaxID=34470 RepID=Q68SR8_PLEDJ|nr:HD2 homeodomain mating-type protein [Pleurotus djamor]